VTTGPAAPARGSRVVVSGLAKSFGEGDAAVHAVRGVSFVLEPQQFVVVLGASGSGKTTLLNLVGAIEEPTAGSVVVAGTEVTALDERGRTAYRRHELGFVFQFFNLVPSLTALENVELIAELAEDDPRGRSVEILQRVGLGDRLDHFPGQLSGGEQQRVAIARALVKRPTVLLCDEPTGALDLETGRTVLRTLRDVAEAVACTVVVVTHNAVMARMADRVLGMRDGLVVTDELVEEPVAPEELTW
jgi:putative ABC transport system ATP-binding protein